MRANCTTSAPDFAAALELPGEQVQSGAWAGPPGFQPQPNWQELELGAQRASGGHEAIATSVGRSGPPAAHHPPARTAHGAPNTVVVRVGPHILDDLSDAELIERVRHGETPAYGVLFERHRAAARRMARQVCDCSASVDDLVSEAFANVLQALLSGRRCDGGFRAYLLTTVRNTAYSAWRRRKKLSLVAVMSAIDEALPGLSSPGADESVVAASEQAMAVQAYARLAPRWQWVLRCTAIDRRAVTEVAAEAGLNAQQIASLAYRARRALRTEFLQAHIDHNAIDKPCRSFVPQLAARVRNESPARRRTQIDAHLASCNECATRFRQLVDVDGQLPRVAGERPDGQPK